MIGVGVHIMYTYIRIMHTKNWNRTFEVDSVSQTFLHVVHSLLANHDRLSDTFFA